MPKPQRHVDLRHYVHYALLSGVVVSGLLLVVGLVLSLVGHRGGLDAFPHSLSQIVVRSLQGEGVPLIELGLLVLMLTPMLRVILLAGGWLIERQWAFAGAAMLVLALLLLSLVIGVS